MTERDAFEVRFEAAVRGYVGRVSSELDPTGLAHRIAVAQPRRHGLAAVLTGRRVALPRVAWVLLLMAALVALVAGTLAVGSRLLESREPLPEQPPALLDGMVVEEIEPGVYRVTGDGVRDLTSVEGRDIMAGHDGGIWLLRKDGFLRLGSDVSHAWPTGSGSEDCGSLEVGPDGTMWALVGHGVYDPPFFYCRSSVPLRSTDGEEWTVQPCPDGNPDCPSFTVAPDGTVWAVDEARRRVSHLGPTGWQALDGVPGVGGRLVITDAGDVYAVGEGGGWALALWRYEEGVWQEQGSGLGNVDVGPDGTAWAEVGHGVYDPALPDDQVGLARSVGGEWELWASADILPDNRFGWPFWGYDFEVAPDGSLWFSLWGGHDNNDIWTECDGLARFDGETLDRFLPGRCPLMDIAADGTVWVLAADDAAAVPREGGFPDVQRWGLYVITPEAMSR